MSLLACLLLHANEVVPRDVLIDALWGEHVPPSAANALNVQVHALRKLIGHARIRTEALGYVLLVNPQERDDVRFERLVQRARGELRADDAAVAARTLGEALALWRGSAFAHVAYDPFAQAEIARLEALRVAALEVEIDAGLALARHVELVPRLEALVSEHPGRERLHGQLMLALYRSGRQTDALATFRRARRALRDEVGLDPGPELERLHQAILRHDPSLRCDPPELRERRHLPAAPTSLIGRAREIEDVVAMLGADVRLVTLSGPGGTGKTRLALQVAHDLAVSFTDGVFFVDLSSVRDPLLVTSAFAHALEIEEQPAQSLRETLQAHLRDRRTLLVVDNFENVDAAAPLLGELLTAAPSLALLVTSRTPLRLQAEHEYRVLPLPLVDAARLFTARARAVAPAFRRPSQEASEVAEICRRLDCLPLAIELAASRTRDHAPAELLELLPRALDLAGQGPRDLPPRHRTLRATIAWSHELLDGDEQALFARLAVFAGGAALAAAEAVCHATRSRLAALAAASMVHERLGGDCDVRYAMLETVREFALEQLEARGEAGVVRARHAAYYASLAEAAEQDSSVPARSSWPLLEEEHDNLRAAVAWSHEAGAIELELRLVGALAIFWSNRGHLHEGRDRVEAALTHGGVGSKALRAEAAGGAAWLALRLGDYHQAEARASESLALFRSIGDEPAIALALNRLGAAVSSRGDIERATSLQQESAAIYRSLGDDRGLGVVLSNLGYRQMLRGRYEQATLLCGEALALLRRSEERGSLPLPLINLGFAALLQERHDEALTCFREGLELADELGYVVLVTYCLDGLAAVLAATGRAVEAATIIGASEAAAAATGASLAPFERRIHDRTIDALTRALDERSFAIAFENGQHLARAEAVGYSLDQAVVALGS
jgi:predicted ATPase/DNA-binding SARP family transcriptional activator